MTTTKFSYKNVGVDISKTDKLKSEMKDMLETGNTRVMNKVGAFASLYDFKKFEDIENPVLVLKSEEPGSKQKLAIENNSVRSVCFDMINHLVNDIAVMGAKPLAVLDTIVAGEVNETVTKELIKGMVDACKENECELVGGETSIQPGILSKELFVLTSSIVGVVDKDKIIDGSNVTEGNVVLAVASNGLHTNGYTLIREITNSFPNISNEILSNGKTFFENIMIPHMQYYPLIKKILESNFNDILAMAHITGGGIEGNLSRVIPLGLKADIDLSLIRPLELFKFIKRKANIDESEMLSTFNCGVGLNLVVKEDSIVRIKELSAELGYNVYKIGFISKSENEVKVNCFNKVNWE